MFSGNRSYFWWTALLLLLVTAVLMMVVMLYWRTDLLPGPDSVDIASPFSIEELNRLCRTDTLVSLSGYVLDQAENNRSLVLADGTGFIWVNLPEAVPLLVSRNFFVIGRLESPDEPHQLRALQWLYDSTAVSSHSTN